ncbi:MAG: prefoldin subunit beta [Thermoprotei archaeon]|nr:MAG: prefoldin subunit beta [Thermoprotei archaeon]
MAERVPPEVQQNLVKLQQLQNQLAQIVTERNILQNELREIEKALAILRELGEDAEVYRSAGHLLIRVKKEDAVKELEDRKEIIEIRLKSLEKQESLVRSRINEVQSQVNKYLAKLYGGKSS